ncbi:DMT family transporter [Mesobacterium pallidum]|uniref:DMT family transporter n=1 Tax=Mesobacterium pallidum TaxID=2872037 RepID=UPI001EE37FF0|nr:DMT family transporter [Mesobacterium pallidum]
MQPMRGILLKLIAVLCFIVMSALIKSVSDSVPPGEAVFFRSAFAFPVLFAWLALRGELSSGLRVADPMSHVWRGFIGTTAMGCGFAAVMLLPLPEVTAIGYAMPILLTIFAAMFLNEKVGIFRLSAIGIGLVGVLIIIAPRLTTFSGPEMHTAEAIGVVLMLVSATAAALAQVYIRKMVATERTSAIVFYFTLTSMLLSLLTLPFGWVIPDLGAGLRLVLAGLIGGVGQIVLTSCYRYAPASVVAPFEYASMIFAIAIGYVWFAEIPTRQTLVGAAIVIAAGVLIIWRERRLGIQREKSKRARSLI